MKNIFQPLIRGAQIARKELRRYFLLLLIPLLLGGLLLQITRSTTLSQIRANANLKVDLLEESASGILSEAERTASMILADPDIQSRLVSDSMSLSECTDVVRYLHFYAENSRYINEIYILNPAADVILDQYGYYMFKSAYALFFAVDNTLSSSPETLSIGWHAVNQDYAPPYYLARFSTGDASQEDLTLVITLKNRDFIEIMYAVDADLCCLYNDQCEISTFVLSHEKIDWESDTSVSSLLGKSVVCVRRQGAYFTYLAALGTAAYLHPLRYIFTAFFGYFAVVSLYCIWVFTREYKRRYQRISALVEKLPQAQPQGESYDELWQSVHSAVVKFRENEQSSKELKRARTMRYLINGYQNADYDILRSSGIEPARGYYTATLFIRNYGSIWSERNNDETVQVLDVIFQTAFSRYESAGFSTACVDTYPNYSVVFSIREPETAKEQIRETLEKVIAFLKESFQLSVRCVVGSWLENAEDIGRSFEETLDTYDFMRAVNSDSTVIFQEELDTHAGVLMGANYMKQLQVLINTALLDKFDLIPSMTDTLIRENILPYSDHFALVRSRSRTVCNVLIETVYRSSLSVEEKREASIELSNSRTSPVELNQTAQRIFPTLSPSSVAPSSNLVVKACDYIGENLSDYNLSLPLICEAVGCSVQHLSRLFRAEMDTTINEYVHTQRINRSIQLLENPSLSIAQIASQVGYSSLDTFSRNFRRQTGTTPSEYRNRLKS